MAAVLALTLAVAVPSGVRADDAAAPIGADALVQGRVEAFAPAQAGTAPDWPALAPGFDPGPALPQASVPELTLVPAADLTRPPASLWTRLRNGFGMPDLIHPAVRQEEDFYANRPEHLRRVIERSRRYLFHIVEVVERRGMPSELALLPIIESAFNPAALSSARAAGMWQFIPSTGLNYGLRQNWWLDGRRDILMSTEAALDYLQKLYEMFGSWDLALAAYNCGEGCVQRAIARNALRGERVDFASLQLPAETRAYVPKLQAVKNIIADPRQFNITLAEMSNEPYFATVKVGQHMDVKVAAKLAGVSVEEFLALNPAHNRSVINVNKLSTVLLPLDRVNRFEAGLRELAHSSLSSVRIYSPRAGESLDLIARRHGIAPAALRRANDIAPRTQVVAAGIDLVIPTGTEARNAPAAPRRPAPGATAVSRAPAASGPAPAVRRASAPARPAAGPAPRSARSSPAAPVRAGANAPRKVAAPTPPARPTVAAVRGTTGTTQR